MTGPLAPIYLMFSNMVINCLRKYIKQGDRQWNLCHVVHTLQASHNSRPSIT